MRKLLWVGDVQANHSLSILARPLVAKLSEEYDVYIREVNDYGHKVEDEHTAIIDSILSKTIYPQLQEGDIEIRCCFPVWTLPPDHKASIVLLFPWEMNTIPIQVKDFINRYVSKVVAISEYSAEIFRMETNKPVSYIPPAIHNVFFQDYAPDQQETPVILYDAGSTWRKGPDLFMNLMSRFAGMNEIKFIWKDTPIYRNFMFDDVNKLNVNCDYLFKNYSFEQMAELYNKSDIVVYPSRGEGFGYSPAQALAMGKIVVAPNHTGLSYLNKNNSFLVDFKETPIDANEVWLSSQYGYKFDKETNCHEPHPDSLYYQTIRALLLKHPLQSRDHLRKYCSAYSVERVVELWQKELQDVIV